MPVLEPGVTFSSPDPVLRVENQLRPGSYEFRLVCVDEGGNESDPAGVTVTVRRPIPEREPPERERPHPFDPRPFEPRRPGRPVVIDPTPPVAEPVEPRRPMGPIVRGGSRIFRPPGGGQ